MVGGDSTATVAGTGANASASASRHEVVFVLPGVLEDCFPATMDEDVRGKYDEEIIVLPNEAEARMLTDSLTLEVLFKGRPKSAAVGMPQVHQHAEQLRCLLRLTRVSLNVRAGQCVFTAGRHVCQPGTGALLGLSGVRNVCSIHIWIFFFV